MHGRYLGVEVLGWIESLGRGGFPVGQARYPGFDPQPYVHLENGDTGILGTAVACRGGPGLLEEGHGGTAAWRHGDILLRNIFSNLLAMASNLKAMQPKGTVEAWLGTSTWSATGLCTLSS